MKTKRAWSYKLLERPGNGLALFQSQFGRQIFTRVNLRIHKHSSCARCGDALEKEAYRPITNLDNRMHRICMRCTESVPMREKVAKE